ncbi:hypothetical protein V6N12_024554 [Hibiscus sabdariffa]|uniref:Uncharacterized protein n=1 Tax=Hibiscus sabdariffa TaxID=183260 RepID=A0ABR2G1E8_9ROSI
MLLVILETTESVISVASIKMSATNRSVIAPNVGSIVASETLPGVVRSKPPNSSGLKDGFFCFATSGQNSVFLEVNLLKWDRGSCHQGSQPAAKQLGKGELRPDVVFPATNLVNKSREEPSFAKLKSCSFGGAARCVRLRAGFLGPDGDWPLSAKAEGSLTARPTRRAGTKVGLSDPTVPSGRAVAQRIKVTLGLIG